jgi:hypothetical protein
MIGSRGLANAALEEVSCLVLPADGPDELVQ